jgi:condensin complex subunit 2
VAKQQTISDETPEESDENQKGKRKTKVVFEIDFLNSEDIDEDVLFANDKKGSITMPIKRDVKNVRHLLPDDMHFSSKQLLHYFLKPEHSVSGPS